MFIFLFSVTSWPADYDFVDERLQNTLAIPSKD